MTVHELPETPPAVVAPFVDRGTHWVLCDGRWVAASAVTAAELDFAARTACRGAGTGS